MSLMRRMVNGPYDVNITGFMGFLPWATGLRGLGRAKVAKGGADGEAEI